MAEAEAMECCWRCGRDDTSRMKVRIQTVAMSKPGWREQCKDTLACISEAREAAQKQAAS